MIILTRAICKRYYESMLTLFDDEARRFVGWHKYRFRWYKRKCDLILCVIDGIAQSFHDRLYYPQQGDS